MRIKRVDKSLPLPKYETEGSVGFDLVCREHTHVLPGTGAPTLIPGNIIAEIPKGYMIMLCLRSSTPRKFGLVMPQSVGIIDNDYCGEDDEIQIQVYNITDDVVTVERGTRIAQCVLVRVDTPELIEVDEMSDQSRGGFGSTGD